jgi:hypothetical protein
MPPTGDTKVPRYAALIESVFLGAYRPGSECDPLTTRAFSHQAERLDISVKTFSSLIYYFRHGRSDLPSRVVDLAPAGTEWVIEVASDGYRARALPKLRLPDPAEIPLIRLPDWTPAEQLTYGRRDEQWVISRLHQNQVFSHFLGGRITLLQHHARTSNGAGQIEIDALLLAQVRDRQDAVVPLQAKSGSRRSSVQAQVRQDVMFCREAYPAVAVRPVGIEQFAADQYLVCEFELRGKQLRVCHAARYELTCQVCPSV